MASTATTDRPADMTGEPSARASFAAWFVLGALSLISLVSFADRYVLLLVNEQVRQAFHLSDVQIGLLQGTGTAVCGALASYPLGWMTGRFDNRYVLAGCIAAWSLAVALSGLSPSFEAILIFSGLVAAGEAGLSPVAYSAIPRLFSGTQRQIANSIFVATAIGGGALAIALAGLLVEMTPTVQPYLPGTVAKMEPWRVSFLLAAAAGPVMVALALLLPIPRAAAPTPAATDLAPAGPAFSSYLWRHRGQLFPLVLGSALAGLAFGAVGPWIAIAAGRLFHAAPSEVGAGMGIAQIGSAFSAFLVSLVVTRVALPRFGAVAPAMVLAFTSVGMLVCCLVLPLIHSATGLYVFFGAFGLFLSLGAMFQPTVYQTLVPVSLIGRMVAVQFIVTMICAAISGPLVGAASDALAADGSHLITAMTVVAIPILILAALTLQMVRGTGFQAAKAEADALNAA